MTAKTRYYLWLAGAIFAAAVLLYCVRQASSGGSVSPWLYGGSFLSFSVTAVTALYWHTRRNDNLDSEQRLIEQTTRELTEARRTNAKK